MFKRLSSLTVLLQFLPLSLFSSYGFGLSQTSNSRWLEAFQIAALLAVFQLCYFHYKKIPLSRLILSANTYLILGGIAAAFQQWWFLELYGQLQETAIFIIMLLIALVTMQFSTQGFIGIEHADQRLINKASLILLLAVVTALMLSINFQGKILLSTVIPLISLAIIQRYLAYKLARTNLTQNDNSHQKITLTS